MLLLHCLTELAAGQPPASHSPAPFTPSNLIHPDTLLSGCCDDYCRKPLPCASPYCPACTAECYCRKPLPYAACDSFDRAADSYDRKPFPNLCRPLAAHYFSCGAANPN
jgi:hypothetical protein